MAIRASGSFEVSLLPQGEGSERHGVRLGRMSLDKRFEGDLVGSGKGEMLSALSATPGSGAYVAIEQFEGQLHGRAGSFVLQHTGRMAGGEQQLRIEVVADSGAGDLRGISGSLALRITEGKHYYEFDYQLPAVG